MRRAQGRGSACKPGCRTPAHRLTPIALIAIVSLIATACAEAKLTSTFLGDGTARHQIEVAIDLDGISPDDVADIEAQIEQIAERVRDDGLTAEVFDTSDELRIRVSDVSPDAADVALELNSLFESLTAADDDPAVPFAGTFERESEAVGGTRFALNLAVDGDYLGQVVRDVVEQHLDSSDAAVIDDDVEIRYVVEMPGDVVETNGSRLGDDGTRWLIPLEGTTAIVVESSVGAGTPWFWIAVTVAVALIVVLGTAAVVFGVLVRQRRSGQPPLPAASDISRSAANGAGMSDIESPDTLSEVGSSLARIVDDVVTGDLTSEQATKMHLDDEEERNDHRGTDTEGN